MGRNHKARRQRRRHADHEGTSGRNAGPGGAHDPFGFGDHRPPPLPAADLWHVLAQESQAGLPEPRELVGQLTRDPARADRGAESVLLEGLDVLWKNGWQPREARRQVRRTTTARSARLVELAISADHDRRPGQGLDPRWAAQLAELGQRDVSTRGPWLSEWREREGLDLAGAIGPIVATLRAITRVPPLEELIPPPGAQTGSRLGDLGAPGLDSDPTLERIRKLLAKAESSEFEAEAAALSAKAQELMTRHAIDVAMVDQPDDDHAPRMIRVPVEAPYADAKSYLLEVVARASRARSVWLSQVAMSSVVGMADDLRGIELMFTSLLVQAQHALSDPARTASPGSRGRTQSYRSAFLLAYADRIKERLTTANEQVIAEAGDASSTFLPVLRARESAVDDFLESHYGELKTGSVRGGYDPAGWAHGRQAADRAKLRAGELPD